MTNTGWRKRTIMELAHDAGLHLATDVNWMPIIGLEYAEKFAKLIREEERERIAKWYESEGHMMFPVAIPDAIRGNT